MTYTTLLVAALAFAGQHTHNAGRDGFRPPDHSPFPPRPGRGAIETGPRADAPRETVRRHLRHLSQGLAAGSFEKPLATHGETPAGVPDMVRLKDRITYSFENMEHGGRVRIRAAGQEARDAVHAFLRYQIRDHATGAPLTVMK